MKNILHSDYWVEIPSGEFITGLSPENEKLIADRMREQFSVDYFPYWKKRLPEDMHRLNLDWKTVYLDKFYISRFQITWDQVKAFHKGAKAANLPGPLNETTALDNSSLEYQGGKVAKVTYEEAETFCKDLDARLPSSLEWEKA